MKLSGKMSADLDGITVKMYGKEGVRLINATLKMKVNEEDAAKKLGADFRHSAFSGMRLVDGVAKHACASMSKPRVVVEQHSINIVGNAVKCVPEISKIEYVDDEPTAIVTIVLPLVCKSEQRNLAGDLAVHVGTVIHPEWEAVQMELPATNGAPVVKKVAQGGFGNPQPKLV